VLFFLPASNIFGSKNAPIIEISIFSDGEVNLVSIFERSKLKIPGGFRKRQEKLKKLKKW